MRNRCVKCSQQGIQLILMRWRQSEHCRDSAECSLEIKTMMVPQRGPAWSYSGSNPSKMLQLGNVSDIRKLHEPRSTVSLICSHYVLSGTITQRIWFSFQGRCCFEDGMAMGACPSEGSGQGFPGIDSKVQPLSALVCPVPLLQQ